MKNKRTPMFLAIVCLVGFTQTAVSEDTPVPRPEQPGNLSVWITGDPDDAVVDLSNGPALLLMGGSSEVDAAFRDQAFPILPGGDIVVIRASGSDGYNNYLYSQLTTGPNQPNSVETIRFARRNQSNSDYVEWVLNTAEMIWMAGGDQSRYVNYWYGTRVQTAMQAAWDRGAVIGGTSAGLAVLGGVVYDPDGVSAAQSDTVLQDPYDSSIQFSGPFIDIPWMEGIITDSHFAERDRMGRTLTFMARLAADGVVEAPRAIAIDERTSLFIDKDGLGTVLGQGAVYFMVEAPNVTRTVVAGTPLEYGPIRRWRLEAGDTINFTTGRISVQPMIINVDANESWPYSVDDPYARVEGSTESVWTLY
ncbi:MAG: cyanophycinase [Candidatus Sumerlaeia bacterium]|nr:cyanophycinase [Candidatus Sumerlaeia bacterium]